MLIIGTPTAYAVDNRHIQHAIESMINNTNSNMNIGIKIVNSDTGEVYYQRNADRSYVPASNQKLFTAYTALVYLGEDFTYKTKILASTKTITDGVLEGDIVVKFSGAPDLRVGHLENMFASLRKKGVKQIKGDVYIDDFVFDSTQMGPGWMWDDAKYCFSSPIRASIINNNCVTLKVMPSEKPGAQVKILPAKRNAGVQFHNKAVTRAKNYKNCYLTLRSEHDNAYQLSGCLPVGSKGRSLSIALQNPQGYAQSIVKSLLRAQGIQLSGKIKIGKSTSSSQVMVEHQSKPVGELIKRQLKESDNLISEALLKKIGQLYFKGQGSWKTGSNAMEEIIEKHMDTDFVNTNLSDGSGLSRYNLVSPDQLVKLLVTARNNVAISEAFKAALPIAAVDGTLEHRMKENAARRRVYAKTGSMVGVISLSGYIETKSGKTLAFSILTNGVAGPLSKYRKLEDQICGYLVDNI